MTILGLKIWDHDTGAALLIDNKVAAISQERLDRKKYSHSFPKKSIDYCLSASGLNSIDDVDFVAIEQLDATPQLLIGLLKQHNLWDKISRKAVFVNHHDAHAASAFFCSPFDDAAVIVVDAAGQNTTLATGLVGVETETFYRGDNNGLHRIIRHYAPINQFTGWLLNFSGVGNFYSQVTYFLGFGKHEEGKTMGLAPYGQGKFISEIPKEH